MSKVNEPAVSYESHTCIKIVAAFARKVR